MNIIDTIEKVRQLKPDRIAFYSYAHVPWIKPGQRKFTELDLPKDEEKRALYELGRTMLEEAGYTVPEAILYYASEKLRLRVPVDAALRNEALQTLRAAQEAAAKSRPAK